MKAFILLNPDLRFAGCTDNTDVHVIRMHEFEAWCKNDDYLVTAVCGKLYRPNWVGKIGTEDGPACNACKKLVKVTEVRV